MLLRASSDALHTDADLAATTGSTDQTGVDLGETLVAFAEQAHARESVEVFMERLGAAAFIEAAATVAIFNGLVRTADASGIPLDEGTQAATVTEREALGLNAFAGASNSPADDYPQAASSSPAIDLGSVFD